VNRSRVFAIMGTVALLAAVAAWWLSDERLTPEEERLVGTWQHTVTARHWLTWVFRPDRSSDITSTQISDGSGTIHFEYIQGDMMLPGRWHVRAGEVIVDTEKNQFRRALRPLCELVGIYAGMKCRTKIEWRSDDEIISGGPDSPRLVWTRSPSD
jgi:hypothetical protein